VLGNQVHVTASRRDDQRLAKPTRQQRGGNAVGIEVVGVDEVKLEAFVQQLLHGWTRTQGQQQRRGAHAHLGEQRVAWMLHIHAMAGFAARGSCHGRTVAEPRML